MYGFVCKSSTCTTNALHHTALHALQRSCNTLTGNDGNKHIALNFPRIKYVEDLFVL